MHGAARGSKSVRLSLALLVCANLGLAGCSGGGGGDADAAPIGSANPSPITPAPTPEPSPGPAPISGLDPIPEPEPEPAPAPAPAPTPQPMNAPPTISGAVISTVTANFLYSFTPAANDPDGDELSFQIQNKPNWATFNTVTGRLSGTPTLAHTGTYSNIRISVSDGRASAVLPAFSIAVNEPETSDAATLSWTAPTQNEDGTALVDLAGYTIVYGPSSSMLHQSVRIENPGIDRYVLDALPAGTYYFGVKAFTSSGVESVVSNIVTKVID